MKRLALLLLLCLPLFSACTTVKVERQTFALCLSLDVDKEGKLVMGILTPMNGGGEGNAAAKDYTEFSVTGQDFDETLSLLAASTPCPLNFSQMKLCVIGYELASVRELQPLVNKLSLLSTMRPDAIVMVALGNALETIKSQNPDFGMRMSTHLNIYLGRLHDNGFSPASTITACVRDLNSGRIDPLLAVCAINSSVKPEEKKDGGQGGQQQPGEEMSPAFAGVEPWSRELLPQGQMAGTLPRTGINPVEYLGSATVGNERVSGLLTAEETRLILTARQEARLKVAFDGPRTQLQLFVSKDTNETSLYNVLLKLQALHCDALGFGQAAAATAYTDGEWKALDMESRYPTAQILITKE